MKNLPISDQKMEELKAVSNADTQLIQLKATILNVLPKNAANVTRQSLNFGATEIN